MPDEQVTIRIVGVDGLTAPAASASRALGGLEKAAIGPTNALGNLVTTLGRVGLAAMGIQAIANTVAGLAKSMVAGNAEFEQYEVSFTTLLGSASAAKAKLEELTEFAKVTPFTLPQVVQASQQLLAYGFAAKDLTDILRTVSDATSTFGGEAMPRAIRALGQIQARGKLASQEMLQLTETGLPAWQMLADKMGVTTGALQDMVSKGLVPADVAIKGLLDGMKERYGGLSEAQSKTFNGMLTNLDDWMGQTKRMLMEPLFDVLKDQLYGFMQYLNSDDVKAGIEDLGSRMKVAVEKSIMAIDNLKPAWAEMSRAAKVQLLGVAIALVAGGPIMRGLSFMVSALGLAAGGFKAFASSAIGRITLIGAAFVVLADLIVQQFYGMIGTAVQNVGRQLYMLGDNMSRLPGLAGQLGAEIRKVGLQAEFAGIGIKESMGPGSWVIVNALTGEVERLANEAVPQANYAFDLLGQEIERVGSEQLTAFQRQIDELTKSQTQLFQGDASFAAGRQQLEEQIRLGGMQGEVARQLMEALYGVTVATTTTTKATKQLGESADTTATKKKQLSFASMSLTDALIAQSPAILSLAADIAYWQSQIESVNLALIANADQLKAANAVMAGMQTHLDGLRTALSGMQAHLSDLQDALAGMQAHLTALNTALSEQQSILSALATPQLTGMRAFSEQISAVERQLNRLRLAELGLPSVDEIQKQYADTVRSITEGGTTYTVYGISTEEAEAKLQELRQGALAQIMAQFPEMTDEMKAYLATLPLTDAGLQKVLETLRLTEGLKYDEQLQRIKEAAEGLQPELSYDEVIARIGQTKASIADLTAQIDVQTAAMAAQQGLIDIQTAAIKLQTAAIDAQAAAMAAQQGVIDVLNAAADALNETLKAMQLQLSGAEAKQKLVSDALKVAYQWYLDDRQAMIDMGATGLEVAGLMDAKTRTLLAAIQGVVDGTSTMTTASLAAMVQQYQIDMALAIAEVNGLDAAIRNIPTTWTTVWTVQKYWQEPGFDNPQGQGGQGGVIPGMQHGGSWTVGGPGGTDSQMVAFRATPGERVTVTPPGQARGIDYDRLGAAVARALGAKPLGRSVSQTIITNQRIDAGQSYLSLKAATGV